MGKFYDHITDEQADLIRNSYMFFIASADPELKEQTEGAGPVNLSPKGASPLQVAPKLEPCRRTRPRRGAVRRR